jgi:hypothetical protein
MTIMYGKVVRHNRLPDSLYTKFNSLIYDLREKIDYVSEYAFECEDKVIYNQLTEIKVIADDLWELEEEILQNDVAVERLKEEMHERGE